MNHHFYRTIIAICVVFHTVFIEGLPRANDRAKAFSPQLPANSKFFDPLLDDDMNLQMIDGEYGDESNTNADASTNTDTDRNATETGTEAITNQPKELTTETNEAAPANIPVSNAPTEILKIPKGQEKFFGLGLLDWIKPMFGGLGYGGLYGAQYYGLGNQNHLGLGLGRPSGWNFPFYNYPYFNYVKKADTELKNVENKE